MQKEFNITRYCPCEGMARCMWVSPTIRGPYNVASGWQDKVGDGKHCGTELLIKVRRWTNVYILEVLRGMTVLSS